jgi:hypothetical protein
MRGVIFRHRFSFIGRRDLLVPRNFLPVCGLKISGAFTTIVLANQQTNRCGKDPDMPADLQSAGIPGNHR